MRKLKALPPSPPMSTVKFRKAVAELRRLCPLTRPVRVIRREKIRAGKAETGEDVNFCGYAYSTRRGYVIVVSTNQTEDEQSETLRHEWAHCLAHPSQRANGTTWQHDDVWGLSYSDVWRKLMDLPTTDGTFEL